MSIAAKHILFVGHNPLAQPGLRNELTRMNPDWQAEFSDAGVPALSLFASTPFDAVIANEALPDMDGFEFLNAVQSRHPDSHRIIVCELGETRAALKTTRMPHHCVPQPWDPETIQDVLERTFALSLWLSNRTVRSLIQRMPVLPSPPAFYFALVRALRSHEVDLNNLTGHASKDPALTAKLLQVANSAALGLRQTVASVQDAISYLGLETTRSLVLLAHSFSYGDQVRAAGFSLERLWQHSIAVGGLARAIARHEKAPAEVVEECFLAGLLHDIGKLLLAVNMPDQYSRIIELVKDDATKDYTLYQAENDTFGASHAEIGAELMATWNLPLTIVEALALHHRPVKLISPAFSPLVAVHVANAFVSQLSGSADPVQRAEIDLTYLWDVGLAEKVESWREVCRAELQERGA